jgi:hypothetical protein
VAGLVLVQRGPGALQCALDGRHAGVDQGGDLAGRPVEHVAQDQHGALSRRQKLDYSEVGQ